MRRAWFSLLLSFAFVVLAFRPGEGGAGSEGVTSAEGAHAAVATDQRLASESGVRVLREGGNAVDAAIAIAYTLAVTYPEAGNLGGGGFMLIRFAGGATHFIDFRETAPAAATARMYLDAKGNAVPGLSLVGPLAAGVPGTVAGLEYARERFATLPRSALMRDAIEYAENGFVLSEADASEMHRSQELLLKYPAAGARLRQPGLANTLRAIEARGADGFYKGDVAREIAASVRAGGGIITEADLAGYRSIERPALTCTHRGDTIVTSPPPSSGGLAVCEILGILGDATPAPPLRSFENTHLEVEAERRAFADRNTQLGDPAFVQSPVSRLLDPAYLAQLRDSIDSERATPSSQVRGGTVVHEGTNTTNFSVVDAAGNAVDVTYTLNNTFGSGFVAGATGVLLNDEMDDFTTKPGAANLFGLVQGPANAIAPGKRPLSSMMPTIVVDAAGRAVLVTGAAGGPHIITAVLDIVRATLDFGEDASTALAAPRIHMQWLPDVLYTEPNAFDDATLARLKQAGYDVYVGHASSIANAIAIRPDGTRVAAHDPRLPSGAAAAF